MAREDGKSIVKVLTFRRESGAPDLSARQIAALEQRLGTRLPTDYRKFLKKHNGGSPSRKFFLLPGLDEALWVTHFLCVDSHLADPSPTAFPGSMSCMHQAYGDLIPADSLIIGLVVSNDLLLLRYQGPRYGQIDLKSIIDLGAPLTADASWGADPEAAVIHLAPGFSAFLEMLTESEPDPSV